MLPPHFAYFLSKKISVFSDSLCFLFSFILFHSPQSPCKSAVFFSRPGSDAHPVQGEGHFCGSSHNLLTHGGFIQPFPMPAASLSIFMKTDTHKTKAYLFFPLP